MLLMVMPAGAAFGVQSDGAAADAFEDDGTRRG